jgi:DNA polymerase III epsilon subunit-like protein
MEVTGLSLEQLQKEGLEPIEAMKQFKNWVNSLVKNDETVVFVGFNASFDWSFINYYFHSFLGESIWHCGSGYQIDVLRNSRGFLESDTFQ